MDGYDRYCRSIKHSKISELTRFNLVTVTRQNNNTYFKLLLVALEVDYLIQIESTLLLRYSMYQSYAREASEPRRTVSHLSTRSYTIRYAS